MTTGPGWSGYLANRVYHRRALSACGNQHHGERASDTPRGHRSERTSYFDISLVHRAV
jgi:hypothetical protein